MINGKNNEYTCMGLMSGTSLDGLDLALCHFRKTGSNWKYEIIDARTVNYPAFWNYALSNAGAYSGFELIKLHKEFGRFSGRVVNEFLREKGWKTDLISSHGHTIFHRPKDGITFQLGDGACIAAETGITTISDFRSADVALGGQGAPLVPVGDELLFGTYDFCLNLGGFSNISYQKENKRVAFDICPVNILLNHFTRLHQLEFDRDGEIASSGKIIEPLLKEINDLSYYESGGPKSLGREWVESNILTLFEKYNLSLNDILRTVCEHISFQISRVFLAEAPENANRKNVLITGGGAYNRFLIELIRSKTSVTIVIPDQLTVDFKEALIFAFLGVLRIRNEINCLSSVTGSKFDHIAGSVYNI